MVSGLACVVVFCTVYALILPAATMEKVDCGLEEHVHGPECYAPAEVEPHAHTEDCYALEKGELICTLEETEEHRHTDDCYAWEEVLTCQLPEQEVQQELVCTLPEHTHDEACRVIGLIGALPSQEEIGEKMALFEDEGDEEAYLTELRAQARKADEAYSALSDELQAKVTNAGRLAELEWLFSAEEQEGQQETYWAEGTNSSGIVVTGTRLSESDERASEAIRTHLADSGKEVVDLRLYTFQVTKDGTPYEYQTGDNFQIGVEYADGSMPPHQEGYSVKVYAVSYGAENTPRITDLFSKYTIKGNGYLRLGYTYTGYTPSTREVIVFAIVKDAGTAETTVTEDGLRDLGIFPTKTPEDDGTWVVYDAARPEDGGEPEDANVKAVITLTGDSKPQPNCYPFICEVLPGEAFYPTDDAVYQAVGESNDVQCYKIHWVEIKEDKTCNFITGMEIGEGKDAEIELTYLKEEAQLKGEKGARKLRVFSSAKEDGTELKEISNSVQEVRLQNENYAGFTFLVTEKCPYVFVSERVEKGYIANVAIGSIVDGSGPFDSTGDLVNGEIDEPGNDRSDNNKVVRSYDTIQYNLDVTFGARQAEVTQKTVKMYFELELGKSATAARFAFDKMLWLGGNYGVEYLDADDNVVMVMDHQGKFYEPQIKNGEVVRDESGFALPNKDKPVSFNSQISGSLAGGDSYKVTTGGVVKQRLTGWTKVTEEGEGSILNGTKAFPMAVEVRNADNGEVFSPTFKLWLDGNEKNYGPEREEGGVLLPAQPVGGNTVTADGNNAVTVSAGTNFNLQLKKNGDMSYKNWFDFSTGDVVNEEDRAELERLAQLEENHGQSDPSKFTEKGAALPADKQARYANYRYGRITCYGIALQLYNDTDNAPDKNRAAKGLKGMSLPVGDITFDLDLWSDVKSGDQTLSPDPYTAILWDYNENVRADLSWSYTYKDPSYTAGDKTYPARGTVKTLDDGLGNGGRRIFWDGEIRSSYAKGGAPSSFPAFHKGCYYGGDWILNGGDIRDVAHPKNVTGSGAGTTYRFTVRDYDFDFDNQHFPTEDAGNSGTVTGYDTYARCFSAGCVQVLNVFPRVQEVSVANIHLNIKVSNLTLTTRAGQELKAKADDPDKIKHEVNQGDNKKRDQIVLYAPGNLTKGNSFNKRKDGKDPVATTDGYLGTDYWAGTTYDCSTFAGDDIWLVSYGMLASGSDYRVGSMNVLQLFDSRALSIRDVPNEPSVVQSWNEGIDDPGEVTFLYAVDPDHPEGYDTNKSGVLSYMNTVREEDLRYFRTKPNEDGNISVDGKPMKCVGVLMEIRGCNLLGGMYQYMRIPIKVNGDDPDLVGKTVATVNTFRVWSYDLEKDGKHVTWADGQWNGNKNTLEGYDKPINGIDKKTDRYSGEVANGSERDIYTKTEYKDGQVVSGTHNGGVQSGNSLLILSYQANVHIGIDNKQSNSGAYIYNQSHSGDRVVDYRVKDIKAETASWMTGAGKPQETELTIRVDLDEDNKTGKDRLLLSGNSYRMRGYEADADGNPVGEEKELTISDDPSQPTSLCFQGSDGKMYNIQVYAQPNADRKSVSFVIRKAPVGIGLPDITFQADFGSVGDLENNDTIKTGVYISGKGDPRAYDEMKGNASIVNVGVVVEAGTYLNKTVDKMLIELDGTINYTVTYNNQGDNVYETIYFYDLLPANGDIRGSNYRGDILLRKFDMRTAGSGDPPSATVYYSTLPYPELYEKVYTFGGGGSSDDKVRSIEAMLNDTGEDKVFYPLGTINKVTGQTGLVRDENLPTGEALEKLVGEITGLYIKVENLKGKQAVHLDLGIETKGNKAGDLYGNIGNSWIAGSETDPLMSNQVQTQVVSRSISGLVWYDKNLNGVRDNGELLLNGVTATLFKKNSAGDYEKCTENVKKEPISGICTTNGEGKYSFDDLAAGNYIVAFSGSQLAKYTGAASYQVHGENDTTTNDGVAIDGVTKEQIEADEYAYYIQYSVGDDGHIYLHKLDEMGSLHLNNGVEAVDHQDLGVVISGPELPMTGGIGTAWHTLGGLALMAGAALWLALRRKREEV